MNCSTSCDHRPFLGLETQLTKKEVAQGDNWKMFELTGVQEDSTPICFSSCQAQTMVSMSLTVYCEWLGPGAGQGKLGGGGGRVRVPSGWDSLCCLVVGTELARQSTGGHIFGKPHCRLKPLLEFSWVHLAYCRDSVHLSTIGLWKHVTDPRYDSLFYFFIIKKIVLNLNF